MGKVKFYTDPSVKLFNQKTNFVGGINQGTTDDLVPEKDEKNLVNFDLTYVGALKKRAGFVSHTNLPQLHKLNSNINITDYPTLQNEKSKRALGMCNTEQGLFEWKDPITRKQYVILLYQNQVFIKLVATSENKGEIPDYEDWQYIRMQKYDEANSEYVDFIQDEDADYEYIYFTENPSQPAIKVEVPIFSDVYDENNERRTIIGASSWYNWLENGLAKTYKVDGVAYGDCFYLATGYKLMVIANEEGVITAKQIKPLVPTVPEFNSIGGNTLSDNPEEAVKSSTGLTLSVGGMVISSKYNNKKLQCGLVNHPIKIRTVTTRTTTPETIYYRYRYQRLDQAADNEWTNKSSEHNGWESFSLDGEHDLEWELKLDQATTYNISIEITPSSNMNTSNWTPTNAGAVSGYIHSSYEVKETPVLIAEGNFSIHTCRRLLVFYDQLLAYYDTLDGNVLYISDVRRFDYFPDYYTLIIDTPEKDAITSINFYQNVLAVLTENNIFMIKGKNVLDFVVVSINRTIGCKYGWTARVVGNYLYFMSKEGLFKLKSLYLTEDRLNVEEVDYKIKPLLNENAVDYIAYTYKGNYYLVEQQPFDYESNTEKPLVNQEVKLPNPTGFYSLFGYEESVIEPVAVNFYSDEIVNELINCTEIDGVFATVTPDTNETVTWIANAYDDTTFVETLFSSSEQSSGDSIRFEFTKTDAFDNIQLGTLEGNYTRVLLDVSGLTNDKSYTVNFDIINQTIDITETTVSKTTTGTLYGEIKSGFRLITDWTRTGSTIKLHNYLNVMSGTGASIGSRKGQCIINGASRSFQTRAMTVQGPTSIDLGEVVFNNVEPDTFSLVVVYPLNVNNVNNLVIEQEITSAGYEIIRTVRTTVAFSIKDIVYTDIREKHFAVKQTCIENIYQGNVSEGWSCTGGIFMCTPIGTKQNVSDDRASVLMTNGFNAVSKNFFDRTVNDKLICYGSDGVVRVKYNEILGPDDTTSLNNFLVWLSENKPKIRLPLETVVYNNLSVDEDALLKSIALSAGIENTVTSNVDMQITYLNEDDEYITTNKRQKVVISDAQAVYLDNLVFYAPNSITVKDEVFINVAQEGTTFSNKLVSDDGKIFIYDPYLDAWTSYIGKYLNFNNVLVIDNNIIATDRNTLTYLVYPYLKFLDKEIIRYNDGEYYYYNEEKEFIKVEDGTNYSTRVEEIWNSFGKPYHIKKFKELMLKVIDSKDGSTGLRIYANIDGIDKVNPISYNIGIDDETNEVYVREVANEDFIPTITKLNSGFILNQTLLGDYDISLHKIRLLGKGKTIKYVIEQVDDKFFGILGYSTVYKEKKPSVKNYK